MITRYNANVSRGKYVFGSVILPYMLKGLDTQGSVFYGNYCRVGRGDEIEINPRLPTQETVLEFKNLTPFEVLCIFASGHECHRMQLSSERNSQTSQISWYLDEENIRPSTIGRDALDIRELMRVSMNPRTKTQVELRIVSGPRAEYFPLQPGYRGVDYHNEFKEYFVGRGRVLELFTICNTKNRAVPSTLGFVENGVLFTEKGAMRDVADGAYISEFGSSSHPKAFRKFELVHSVMQEVISLALPNLVKIISWEYEGELYSLRIRRDVSDRDYNIPLSALLEELSEIDSKILLWDEFRGEPISVLCFEDAGGGSFQTQPFGDRGWCVARALYSLIFIEYRDDLQLFHMFVNYVHPNTYDMKFPDKNGKIRELMVIESIRQYFQAQALGREILTDVEEAYEDTLESLHYYFKHKSNNPHKEYFKRVYPLDRELALHVTDRAVILYSPTFIHVRQEFYIFGYALINSSSFYSGEPNPKIFIYDLVVDYAFRDTFLTLVLQKAKHDGDDALHYDDGRTYGCVLDLSRIQGLVREDDLLLLGDQFEPNETYRNMVARSQKALSQDRYREVLGELEEKAYAKSQ
jgi:hypothetical protein